MAKWDDELDAVLRGKGVDPTAAKEEVTDPGMIPGVTDIAFWQMKTEMRTYAKAAAHEIEELKAAVERLNAIAYEHDVSTHTALRRIDDLIEVDNILYGKVNRAWYRNPANYVYLFIIAYLIILLVVK